MSCKKKTPPHLQKAKFLILLRERPYDLALDGLNIDQRLVGVCSLCLEKKNDFQKHEDNLEAVDPDNPNLISYNI